MPNSGTNNIQICKMNKEFWEEVYKDNQVPKEPSQFAKFCLPQIRGHLVDLGCGNGRDLYYFNRNGVACHGVDASKEDRLIIKQDVAEYLKENKSPDNVYTRFFWHAIEPDLQEAILKWTKKRLFIEARTTKDKPSNVVGAHARNLVSPNKLKKQLIEYGFKILNFEVGQGYAIYKNEDAHVVRVTADKS